ncbi:MAG: DNA-3-methyladenine glycosylase [Planctomycetota bacterium]|nr:DNA-3-methyladenine glycosylase [Planctomycetota bacterium]MEC8511391.1 DNA-3-methyladenine glycosylase [Planctomycetota bacterium]
MSAELLDALKSGAQAAAPRLLGVEVVTRIGGALARGRIVETEAYLAEGDAASHSARGPTRRNASMFEAAGAGYVYLIYGMHLCFNVVTGAAGEGEAVLIRALEPLEGLEAMRSRRGARVSDRDLCRGPGRLAQALGIEREDDGGALLAGGRIQLIDRSAAPSAVEVGPRIGITKSAELPLRFRDAAALAWCS